MPTVPVWVWLPGDDQPIEAAELQVDDGTGRFRYLPDYLARGNALSLDPVELRLTRSARGVRVHASDGLPGVIRDAKPAGYGADRLNAHAGTELSPLELLERGVPDAVGALEVCADIDRKLGWVPKRLDTLRALAEELDGAAPASRALRKLNDDLDTSAGGERPKTTISHDGRLWLAKMQDRGDRPALPAREYVAMTLARDVGLDVAPVALHTFGSHQVLLVERFDRGGDPQRPTRRLYASAHTVLRLRPDSTKGDPQRSYLNFGDRLRIWMRGDRALMQQLGELWRRMSFNALVGNVDDHPLNHGLLRVEGAEHPGWRLAPAFDITPVMTTPLEPADPGPVLSMATGVDNSGRAGLQRLVAAAGHFGVDAEEAHAWVQQAASTVAERWEGLLRWAVGPALGDDKAVQAVVSDTGRAFAFGEWVASRPSTKGRSRP